jgi:Cytotoxic
MLPGFPNAKRARPKTPRAEGGLRTRWKDAASGRIYEWDYQHGRVEGYDAQGNHVGEFDPQSGRQTKPRVPSRKVTP